MTDGGKLPYPRAKEGDQVVVEDPPTGHPVFDGRPLQLYDRVRTSYGTVGVVTEIRVRCWGRPGREQVWTGSVDGVVRRDSWIDQPIEQVWISLDAGSQIYHADDILEVLP